MSTDLPLESYFRTLSAVHQSELPGQHDYVSTYFSILSTLNDRIYPAIDIALTQSEDGIFSFHNKDHFDEVVKKAGELIDVKKLNPQQEFKNRLSAYEIFALLIAIRIHDAGNCYGRVGHEKRCEDILLDVHKTGFPYRETELMSLAEIAQAHGGELPGGDKDVIGRLPPRGDIGDTQIQSQRIAALVRLADELAENNMRTPVTLLDLGLIPKKNQVYHQYAKALQSNSIERLNIGCKVNLRYLIEVSDAKIKFGKEDKEVFLIDEIKRRLIKMNLERVYCNRFLEPHERLESISAKINIRDNTNRKLVWSEEFLIRDEGYPITDMPKDFAEKLDGEIILNKINEIG